MSWLTVGSATEALETPLDGVRWLIGAGFLAAFTDTDGVTWVDPDDVRRQRAGLNDEPVAETLRAVSDPWERARVALQVIQALQREIVDLQDVLGGAVGELVAAGHPVVEIAERLHCPPDVLRGREVREAQLGARAQGAGRDAGEAADHGADEDVATEPEGPAEPAEADGPAEAAEADAPAEAAEADGPAAPTSTDDAAEGGGELREAGLADSGVVVAVVPDADLTGPTPYRSPVAPLPMPDSPRWSPLHLAGAGQDAPGRPVRAVADDPSRRPEPRVGASVPPDEPAGPSFAIGPIDVTALARTVTSVVERVLSAIGLR